MSLGNERKNIGTKGPKRTFHPPERVSTTADGPSARWTMPFPCRKDRARETLARPWSTSSLETLRASLALADEKAAEEAPPPPPDPGGGGGGGGDSSSSAAVPQTPSVTNASRCLVSSRGSMTLKTFGCLTRARAAAPARAAASAASPSSGEETPPPEEEEEEEDAAASRTRLSMSQTETSGRAAAEPVFFWLRGREREREES